MKLFKHLRNSVLEDVSSLLPDGPIPLNANQCKLASEWAKDDRLWNTQGTVELSLQLFAVAILKSDQDDITEAHKELDITGTARGNEQGDYTLAQRISGLGQIKDYAWRKLAECRASREQCEWC